MQESLNRRNTESVFQALKDMNKKVNDQQIRIDGLNNTIANLINRIEDLEKYIREQRIKNMGSGSTSK